MIEWTESARRLLNDYCARSKAVLAGGGADPDEVSEDLRRHVEEEVRAAKLSIVTEDDVRRILSRIGDPGVGEARRPEHAAEPVRQPGSAQKKLPGVTLLAFGVVFPALTWVFEVIFGASAGALFDPFPTWLHVLAVLLVPVANGWIWSAARAGNARRSHWLGWLNGIALGTAIYYSVLYLAFAPYACVGIIFFGLGLLPLSPYFAAVATPILRQRYVESIGKPLPGAWLGALGAIVLLLLIQFPTAATYYGMAKSISENPDTKAHGIRVLRTFGDREMMLRACYGSLRRELEIDLIRSISGGDTPVSADQAREAYYRVTGKAFNAVPPPALYTRTGRWAALDEEFTWDDALGGEAVAQRVKGLSLLSSRMDAVAEPEAALVYCEWIMEFKNVSPQQREARAQVALPPGAVVSRVTLWIDGEEREAAFGGRSQVRQAYQEVAVVQRRDPILVTTCGPDRVLMQCFPVPANGGVMKVKLGITAPLLLEAMDRGQFVWPKFLERNFAISSDLKHDLWIESSQRLANGKAESAKPISPDRPYALRESFKETALMEAPRNVTVHRSADVREVWTPSSSGAGAIRQAIAQAAASNVKRLVLVVDGSHGMKPFVRELSEALPQLPSGIETAMIIASDRPQAREGVAPVFARESVEELQRRLRSASFDGGQDNVPALEVAWDLASAVENGVVLWIHEPGSVMLSAESGLRQRFERNVMKTRLLEFQTETGPDRVIEKLDGYSAFQQVPRLGSVSSDLGKLFGRWKGDVPAFELKRERVGESPGGLKASRHVERLWAQDEAARLAKAHGVEEAMKLAVQNQLVTPLTGAVVLERKEQYERHGLSPAEAGTVPSVPEPSAFSVLGVGILVLALLKRRGNRAA